MAQKDVEKIQVNYLSLRDGFTESERRIEMAEIEIKVQMEAWRYVRRAMEREQKREWCPDPFEVTCFLETGRLNTPVPESNWKTTIWYNCLRKLRRAGVKHGREAIAVMMIVREEEAVLDNGFLTPTYPGKVRLAEEESKG